MASPKDKAAEKKATFDAEVAKTLNEVTLPNFVQIAARANWGLNGGVDQLVDEQFKKPEQQLEKDFIMATRGGTAAAKQQSLQWGGPYDMGALDQTIRDANRMLEWEKQKATTNMELSKAEQKLASYNDFTNLLNKESGMLLDIARGNSANWGASIGGLKGTNPWASAAAGAASGAGTGAVFGPWGAVIGGIAGGAMGYFGGR